MELNGTTIIKRPVDVVFAYVSDVSNDATWRASVDESGWRSTEPMAPGSIGYTRAGSQEIEWKVLTVIPNERIEWELLNGPFKGRGGYLLLPVEGGTQFTLLADIEPTGLYKLLGPLFNRIGRRQNQADVEKLREVLESTAE
jgi:uncharacterized membrane protein